MDFPHQQPPLRLRLTRPHRVLHLESPSTETDLKSPPCRAEPPSYQPCLRVPAANKPPVAMFFPCNCILRPCGHALASELAAAIISISVSRHSPPSNRAARLAGLLLPWWIPLAGVPPHLEPPPHRGPSHVRPRRADGAEPPRPWRTRRRAARFHLSSTPKPPHIGCPLASHATVHPPYCGLLAPPPSRLHRHGPLAFVSLPRAGYVSHCGPVGFFRATTSCNLLLWA